MPITLVSTLYKSAFFLEEFVARCLSLMDVNDELILVDDGSPDESLAIARGLAAKDSRITVIELARNFGHHPAILAGLEYTKSEHVFFVDSDLEEAPELLTEFAAIMTSSNADVVFGIHDRSRESFFRSMTSGMFWRVFNWSSDSATPMNICNVRLMSRRYVDALVSLPEVNVFLGGMFHWVGFRQIGVPIERRPMRAQSTYSVTARISLAIRSIVSFSTAPLKAMFFAGITIAILGFLLALYYAILKFVDPTIELGFTSLIISIWFLSGVIVACLGVIGIYLAYMYAEIKRRPRVIVREVFNLEKR